MENFVRKVSSKRCSKHEQEKEEICGVASGRFDVLQRFQCSRKAVLRGNKIPACIHARPWNFFIIHPVPKGRRVRFEGVSQEFSKILNVFSKNHALCTTRGFERGSIPIGTEREGNSRFIKRSFQPVMGCTAIAKYLNMPFPCFATFVLLLRFKTCYSVIQFKQP